MQVIVIGGGPAGFFAALRCKELAPQARVLVLEKGRDVLTKVAISGGGRCNVTQAQFDPRELIAGYPRGARELLGPLTRFGPTETVAWFADHGVVLKTEPDGRMFPTTDRSRTVIDALTGEARRLGVEVRTRYGATALRALRTDGDSRGDSAAPPLEVTAAGGERLRCDRVLLATGGQRRAAGYDLAAGLGHSIVPPVPSLFTFQIDDPRLSGLAGVAVERAEVAAVGRDLRNTGPLLITHTGLSGPAVIVLSARGARELHAAGHRCELSVNWAPPLDPATADALLQEQAATGGRRRVGNHAPVALPRRLWAALVAGAGIGPERTYGTLVRDERHRLAAALVDCRLAVKGVSPHREEFVTCGGVALPEVDFRSMASRRAPGLFLAGEVLDIDGITGGWNLQAAWTTGWIAGQGLAAPEPIARR